MQRFGRLYHQTPAISAVNPVADIKRSTHWDENRTQNFFLTKYSLWLYMLIMTAADLKLWRKRWGITQVDLARRLGTYQVTVARWETEARKIPFLLPLALEALENRMKEKS